MTYFLIDSSEAHKVLDEFESPALAMEFVDAKEFTENWENGWDTFSDFKDQFYTVDSDEMNEAVRIHGSRKKNYWT
jgi:hypothetical protein